MYLWNVDTLAWEPATKGPGTGAEVEVVNWPAVISGSYVPIEGDVNIDSIVQYTTRLAEDSGNPDILYVGQAVPGSSPDNPVWRIKRVNTSSGIIIQWADGNDNFDNIWNNRESLSYS
jgi:hypothetical protein